MGIRGNVASCKLTPEDVKLLLKENEEKRLATKDAMSGGETSQLHDDDDEASQLQEISMIRSGKRPVEGATLPAAKKSVKGPLDSMFYKRPDLDLAKGKQTSINDAYAKEAREKACQYIAQFFYRNGIAFNVARSRSFKLMIEAIGQCGPTLKPPSYHELRIPMLNKELKYTHSLLKSNKEQQVKYGCSIMSDGWMDTKSKTCINFLVNSPAGTMFVRSVDASNYVKDGDKLFKLLDKFVEEIGESNIMQLITDNGSNYKLAGKCITGKRPRIFWTPCAAHCLDLMLEDIGKIPRVKKVIQKETSVVSFIYNHSLVLNLMREICESELVRAGVTRFATTFLTLKRLHDLKANLRKMFTFEAWMNLKASKDPNGRNVETTVLQVAFWDDVIYTLKAMGPLVKVLRLVDNEKKPAMGYIYKAMLNAKEIIKEEFNNKESKHKEIIAIIDKRWKVQLHHPLHAARHYLNPAHFHSNPQIENDSFLLKGLYDCIENLSTSVEVEDAIYRELIKYRASEGFFSRPTTIRN